MAICGIVPCLLGLFPRTLMSSTSTAFLWALFPPYHLSIWLSPYFFRKRLKIWASISGTSFALPWKAISETSTSTSEFSTAFFHQWESSWARKYSFPSSNANHNSTVLFSRVFLPLVVRLRYGESSSISSLVARGYTSRPEYTAYYVNNIGSWQLRSHS